MSDALLINALRDAKAALRSATLQIEYLHEKFGETGSGNGVLAQIDHVLSAQPAAPVDEREAFEASVIARNSAEYNTPRFLLELNSAGKYATVRIQSEWIGWQARAALQEPTK